MPTPTAGAPAPAGAERWQGPDELQKLREEMMALRAERDAMREVLAKSHSAESPAEAKTADNAPAARTFPHLAYAACVWAIVVGAWAVVTLDEREQTRGGTPGSWKRRAPSGGRGRRGVPTTGAQESGVVSGLDIIIGAAVLVVRSLRGAVAAIQLLSPQQMATLLAVGLLAVRGGWRRALMAAAAAVWVGVPALLQLVDLVLGPPQPLFSRVCCELECLIALRQRMFASAWKQKWLNQ